MRLLVGPVEDLRRDGCRLVEVDGRTVGVISVGDEFFAVHDRCPHMGASMCAGTLAGTFEASAPQELLYGRHDRVIRCPWHGWEFDLETGRSLLQPDRFGLRTYQVTVESDVVVIRG
jgi:nitrite reductase (NADH) small subunit